MATSLTGTLDGSPAGAAAVRRARAAEGATARALPDRRVALVHLGHPGGLGTTRRVEVWQELLVAAGIDVVEVNLLERHRRLAPSPTTALRAARGTVVPEAVTWSARAAARAIKCADPDAVVFVTARAFHPLVARAAPRSVLDFQDVFSRSYRGRAAVDRRPGAAAAWRALAWVTERFERRDHRARLVTAGWAEAREIGATWVPNTVSAWVAPSAISDHADAPTDLLFFGKLTALPNLDAVRQLGALWPRVAESVPGVTMLLAGRGTCPEIVDVAERHGWAVDADFPDVTGLCQKARVALAPLRHASGIQNKVLEAAAAGLPQVLSPQAVRGMAPGLPALVAGEEASLVDGIARLVRDGALRLELAQRAHAHVIERYSPTRWAEVAGDLVTSR